MDSNERKRNLMLVGVLALVVFLCVGSFSATAAFGYFFFRDGGNSRSLEIRIEQPAAASTPGKETPTPARPRETPKATKKAAAASQPTGAAVLPPIQESESEAQLAGVIVPTRDLRDLALRLRPDVDSIPQEVAMTEYKIGDEIEFWASNVDDKRQFKVKATLIYTTDVAYVWVESGKEHDKDKIIRSVDTFSEKSYPVEREFFGSEWKPGIDKDPRLHILHANDLGSSIAGYYSSADEFSNLANEFSNEKEMFYISLEWLNRSRDYAYYETVLAHEFQHMIHWYNDRNEETWVNEGLSELAQEVAGYPPDTGFASVFASIPDTQLNTWSDNPAGNGEHYGSAYLFMAYLLQRFGEDVTKAVVAHPANGIAGVSEALAETGHPLTFQDVFADWLVANYANDPDALGGNGLYGYKQLQAPSPSADKTFRRYPVEKRSSTVRNFGADYLELQGSGDVTFRFRGNTETRLANVTPFSGQKMFWSNRADDSDSRLTQFFDFSGVAPGTALEMRANLWYDIENDYDYLYLLVSEDDKKWEILPGQRTTTEDPSGNSFGHAYTGESSPSGDEIPEWIEERYDLSAWAGKKVSLRFEYVTDDAVNYPGAFVDDISIPAIGYSTDFENGPDGWESEGWLLTDNRLPQRWIVQVLAVHNGQLVGVERATVTPTGETTIQINGLSRNTRAVVIISGATPVTTEEAQYEYSIEAR
ncbi:MAG: immune inhibitor A [Caldilineaceae bacterium]|nr:immune inhibitor A [Caldilineaceae bacterium]